MQNTYNLNKDYNWFVVYTKPRWEKKVAHLLTRKGIENYCPLRREQRQWSDRKKVIEVPLFTSYVFVHIPTTLITEVRKTSGILNFLYWLGKPAVVRKDEIETIRKFLNESKEVELEKIKVNVEDQVRILRGPLISEEGTVMEVMNSKAKVLLPSLGYALLVTVDKDNLKKLETYNETVVTV